MKKIFFAAALLLAISTLNAQKAPSTYTGDDEGTKGFKRENVFVGGSLGLGFANHTFNVGANPEIGYSLAEWLDAGIVLNINYTSQAADPYYVYNDNTRYRAFNYGAGVFARVYPVNFLFLQVQPEQNWIHYSAKSFSNDQSASQTVNASSFIIGAGYTQRAIGQGSYYLMIGLDLLNNRYSPYRDSYTGAAVPIVRAGYDIYLRPRKSK